MSRAARAARRGRFEIVYVDPPWHRTPCGTAKTPYKTMTWAELHAFDLGRWLARDCIVFVWTTGPTHLKDCAVLAEWCERFGLHEAGVAYRWIKTLREGLPSLPPGYTLHGTRRTGLHLRLHGDVLPNITWAELHAFEFEGPDAAFAAAWKHWREYGASREWLAFVDRFETQGLAIGASGPRAKLVKQLGEDVIALTSRKRGRVFPLLTEGQSQWIFAPKPRRGEHSLKPAIVRSKIVELLGDRSRVELFARERVELEREGWEGWGDEYPAGVTL